MGLGRYIVEEIKKLSQNRMMFISVLVALLVPLVYSAIILSAKWWPTDNLDNVPVAVVNNDAGAVRDGERINIGEELIENLQDNNELDWKFVTESEANLGMKNDEYFMLVEVPENFSKDAITVLDENPKRPVLNYVQNEGLHYQGTTVTDTAIESLKNQLSTQITETYVDTMFAQLGDVADGFEEAHDGAEQIEDGAGQLKDGSEEILSALVEKAPDISRLADGSQELNAGTNELLSNLREKSGDISRLADGANELSAGAGKLKAGTGELKNGTGRLKSGTGELTSGASELEAGTGELKAGTSELKKGTKELKNGTSQLKEGSTELRDGINEAKAGSQELLAALDAKTGELGEGVTRLAGGTIITRDNIHQSIASMKELKDALEKLATTLNNYPFQKALLEEIIKEVGESIDKSEAKSSELEELVNGAEKLRHALADGNGEFKEGLTRLNSGLGELSAGSNRLVDGTNELDAGANRLVDGANELDAGASELNSGAGRLKAGARELDSGAAELLAGANQLDDGAGELSAGAIQVADGNQDVKAGWNQLQDGATQLHDGSTQIADGTSSVRTGWGDLTDGVTQVDDGLFELLEGSTQLAEGLYGGVERTSELNPTDDNKTMFAEPVLLAGKSINEYQYYRDANAPYILTLALFVGVLALSFVVSYNKPAAMPNTALTWYVGKVTNLILLVTAQALIVSLYSLIVLKMQVQSSLGFVLFSIWVSLSFLMIVLFLVALAGNIGRFIALAFVVLQLSTTGSALPIHMLPEGLRNLSVFLPFTHSINGFKNIITLGNSSVIWASTSALFVYFIIFAVLSLAVFFWKYRSLQSEQVEVVEEAA